MEAIDFLSKMVSHSTKTVEIPNMSNSVFLSSAKIALITNLGFNIWHIHNGLRYSISGYVHAFFLD